VADFIGKINSLEGNVEEEGGKKLVNLGFIRVAAPECRYGAGEKIRLFLRPEDISLADANTPGSVEAVVEQATFQGASYQIHAFVAGQKIFFNTANSVRLQKDDKIFILINTDMLILV